MFSMKLRVNAVTGANFFVSTGYTTPSTIITNLYTRLYSNIDTDGSSLIFDVTYYNRIFTGRRHSTASINTYIDLLSTLVDKAKTSDEIVEKFIETHTVNKPRNRRVAI